MRIYGTPAFLSGATLLTRGKALLVTLLSGGLGWVVLTHPIVLVVPAFSGATPDQSTALLFPLFTGLFALPSLALSRLRTPSIPQQSSGGDFGEGTDRRQRLRGVLSGSLAGALVGWFPGLSGAVATTVADLLGRGERSRQPDASSREALIAIGGANASTALFTLVALFTILRARSGAAAAIDALSSRAVAEWEPFGTFPWALALLLVASVVATALGLFYVSIFGRLFVRLLSRMPYRKVIDSTIVFLIALIFILSGPMGLCVAGLAAATGALPPLLGVRRVHLMGALIIPVILFIGVE